MSFGCEFATFMFKVAVTVVDLPQNCMIQTRPRGVHE